jgi:hypothetical protein
MDVATNNLVIKWVTTNNRGLEVTTPNNPVISDNQGWLFIAQRNNTVESSCAFFAHDASIFQQPRALFSRMTPHYFALKRQHRQ